MAQPYVKISDKNDQRIVTFHRSVGKTVRMVSRIDVTGLTIEAQAVAIQAELEAVRGTTSSPQELRDASSR